MSVYSLNSRCRASLSWLLTEREALLIWQLRRRGRNSLAEIGWSLYGYVSSWRLLAPRQAGIRALGSMEVQVYTAYQQHRHTAIHCRFIPVLRNFTVLAFPHQRSIHGAPAKCGAQTAGATIGSGKTNTLEPRRPPRRRPYRGEGPRFTLRVNLIRSGEAAEPTNCALLLWETLG